MRTHVFHVGLLLAVSLAGGCALGQSAAPGEVPDPLAQEAPDPNTPRLVHVQNRNWQDLDVYAVREGTRIRLGSVSAVSTRDFRLPGSLTNSAGDFQVLVVAPGDSNGFLTQVVLLRAGETLDLDVEPTLSLSSYRIH